MFNWFPQIPLSVSWTFFFHRNRTDREKKKARRKKRVKGGGEGGPRTYTKRKIKRKRSERSRKEIWRLLSIHRNMFKNSTVKVPVRSTSFNHSFGWFSNKGQGWTVPGTRPMWDVVDYSTEIGERSTLKEREEIIEPYRKKRVKIRKIKSK